MNSVQLPIWVVAVFGLVTAIGGLTGVAALINSLSSAKKSRVESLCEIIDAQDRRIQQQEHEINELRQELNKTQAQSKRSQKENAILKSRIKLLAKIMTQILQASDAASCVDDLVNGMQVTPEEREFLIEVVEEANHR
jgi:septal ring factor EnvC (AmiA/AmiB activator)